MAGVKGLRSFVVIAAVVFGALRVAHVGVPLVFPETRQAPVGIASLDDVGHKAGFPAIVPAYRPATLGARPSRITLAFGPQPTLVVVWQEGDQYLSVTQRQGGPRPSAPPLARPFDDLAGSTWWVDGARSHLVLSRGEFWIEIETSLPPRDLKRFADTLSEY